MSIFATKTQLRKLSYKNSARYESVITCTTDIQSVATSVTDWKSVLQKLSREDDRPVQSAGYPNNPRSVE
ncbi:MAG: hypothetical protein RIK87_14745 [Fuerstiella sp.]